MMWDPSPPPPSRRSWSTCLRASTQGYRALPSPRRRSGLSFRLAWSAPNLRHRSGRSGGSVFCAARAGRALRHRTSTRPTAQLMSQPRRHRTCLDAPCEHFRQRAGARFLLNLTLARTTLARSGIVRAMGLWPASSTMPDRRHPCDEVSIRHSGHRATSNCANQRAAAPADRGTLGGHCPAAMTRRASMRSLALLQLATTAHRLGNWLTALRRILAGPRPGPKSQAFSKPPQRAATSRDQGRQHCVMRF